MSMEQQSNREYVRTDNWSVNAKVSKDRDAERWLPVEVPNIAAGGLLFLTDMVFNVGDELWVDMMIDPLTPGITGKIPMMVQGDITVDRGLVKGLHAYAVRFTVISHSERIRLDELIRITNYKGRLDEQADIFDR